MANCTRKLHLWEYISVSNGFSAVTKWISSKIQLRRSQHCISSGNLTAKREGKAQTQTQASKPLKWGTSAVLDLKIWKKKCESSSWTLYLLENQLMYRFKAINYWRKRNLLILYFFVQNIKVLNEMKALCARLVITIFILHLDRNK